jgi:PAS domain S-box-containing protein
MVPLLRHSEHVWRSPSKEATARALSAFYQTNQQSGDQRYRGFFQKARVALWDEDFSPVLEMLDRLRAEGVCDLRSFFYEHPKQLIEAIDLVRLNDVNEYTVKLFEAERKDDLLRSLSSVFVPESEAVFLEELVTLWEGRRSFESEMALRTLKGRHLDVIFSVAYEGANCERTLVSIVDISARKAAEAKAQKLASIIEHSEDAIYSIDLDGNIRSWNRGAERLYGYSADEVIGRPITLSIPQDRLEEERTIIERIRRGESIEHYETVRQRKDGQLLDISLAASPVRSADGVLIGAAKIGRDISERKRAHEQQRLLVNEMKHRIKNTLARFRPLQRKPFNTSIPTSGTHSSHACTRLPLSTIC